MIEAQWQIPASPRWVRRQVVGSRSERVEEIQPQKGTVAFGGKTLGMEGPKRHMKMTLKLTFWHN